MNQDPLRRVQEILHDLVFFLQDNISWEQFLTDCLFAVVSAVILVAFWNKVKQRFLIDSNRVPFVDIDMHNQRIRNIGSESATNILLFHIVDNHDDEHTQIHFMNDIPSLLSGESIEGRLTMDTCFWPEFFLLQYTNAVGIHSGRWLLHQTIEEIHRSYIPLISQAGSDALYQVIHQHATLAIHYG